MLADAKIFKKRMFKKFPKIYRSMDLKITLEQINILNLSLDFYKTCFTINLIDIRGSTEITSERSIDPWIKNINEHLKPSFEKKSLVT